MLRRQTLGLALAVGATLATQPAAAREFPTRPIKIVVAFNAGGLTDVLARITADFLSRRLGQPVVVENKPGAAGAIAADYVAKAPADGYTLYLAAADLAVLPAVRSNLSYKIENFSYLSRFWTTVTLIAVGPKSKFTTPNELIAYMKANPGKLSYGTTGMASLNHLGTAMFESAAGVKGLHVPYAGNSAIYTALLASDIDFATGAAAPLPDGIKVLGPAGTRRHPYYPDLPTLGELGFKDASYDAWFGFLAPPNVPKNISARLIEELNAVFKDPDAIARYRNSSKEVPDPSPLVGEDFRKQVLDENRRWKAIVQAEKISIQ
ncbi:tripartite tricarboxylate transporter substrate binding protein [Xylophilus sp. GW821-FHT01B05]